MRTRKLWIPGLALLVVAFLVGLALLDDRVSGPESSAPNGLDAPRLAVVERPAALPDPLPPADAVEALPTPETAEPATVPTAGALAPATVRGRVLDQAGTPVPAVTVSLVRGRSTLAATTDSTGAFQFEPVPPGIYRLLVESASLPDGLLPPWGQHRGLEPEHNPDGVFGTALRLTAGVERAVDLRVFAAGAVQGRVVGADGAPCAGAIVTVDSASGIRHDARSEADGRFVLAPLHPGRYVTSVRLPPGAVAGAEAGESAPLPLRFDLAPGQQLVLEDLVAGSPGHVLRGSVVDAGGQAVAGLPVMLREEREDGLGGSWRGETDSGGRYALGRIPPGTIVVHVGAADAGSPAGAPLLREAAEPLRVIVQGPPGPIDVPEIRVEASRPFRLVGRLRVDPAWAGAERWQASAAVRPVGAAASADGTADDVQQDVLRVSDMGSFRWTCSTPHPEVELVVIVRRSGGAKVEWRERLQPVADELRELVVDVP